MAPSTYDAARPRQLCARAQRNVNLAPRLRQLWEDHYCVYGARELWRAARRVGLDVRSGLRRCAVTGSGDGKR